MVSASLLIVTSLGLAVGALAGLALDGRVPVLYLGILAGFVATLVASFVRNQVLGSVRPSRAGIDEHRIPLAVMLFAAVSSLGGSSAAVEVAMQSDMSSGAVIGALAGLFSTILAAMLIITYHMRPGEHSSRKH